MIFDISTALAGASTDREHDEEDDHYITEGIGQRHDPGPCSGIGASPQGTKNKRPAEEQQRAGDNEAVEHPTGPARATAARRRVYDERRDSDRDR